MLTYGQTTIDNNRTFNVNLLQSNFISFRDSLEQIHPALYRYRSKIEIDKLFDSCYTTITPAITEMQFYMLLRFMTSAIEDGHTAVTLEKGVMNEQLKKANIFPLKLWFIENKAFLLCHYNKEIPAGTEIVSINNSRINNLRTTLFKYLVSDGKINTKKYSELNEGGFPFLYYWLYGEKKQFTVEYKTLQGKTGKLVVQSCRLEDMDCSINRSNNNQYLRLEIKKEGPAILTIKSFDLNSLNADENYFKRFLDSAFSEIGNKKVSKLIIDLRDNGGGEDSYGALLFSYLTDKPFSYYSSLKTISYTYPQNAHPNLATQQPSQKNYKGKCFFLINGRSFSSTSEFCAIAKSNKRGEFIGTETGGGYYGNTGGEHSRFTLPGTNIVVIIPHRRYDLAVIPSKHNDRGTIADHYIIPTVNDVIESKDVQLNYALKLALKDK